MAYTSNPHIGKTRRKAVNDVLYHGCTQDQVARYYGVARSTVCKWMKRASSYHRLYILTRSSEPKKQAKALDTAIVERIVVERMKHQRCAPVIHAVLKSEGIKISLSSVERRLRRQQLTRKKCRASFYKPQPRPVSDRPGALVQVDTIHFTRNDYSRFYIVTVLDTFSRLAFALYTPKLSQKVSLKAIAKAQEYFGFHFEMVQTDNGPEFKDYVMQRLGDLHIAIRHSRVRKPNDNAHLERFNRTIQEVCFDGCTPNEDTVQQEILNYLEYYNNHRLHLRINCLTPRLFVSKLLT